MPDGFLETVRIAIHIVSFTVNGFAVYVTVRRSTPEMNVYKWYLLAIAVSPSSSLKAQLSIYSTDVAVTLLAVPLAPNADFFSPAFTDLVRRLYFAGIAGRVLPGKYLFVSRAFEIEIVQMIGIFLVNACGSLFLAGFAYRF